METLNYEKVIHAPIQKVWDLLWNPESYKEWTQFFMQDSQLKTDWKVNGKTYFVDGKGDGMVSTIKSLNEPYEIVFSHLGIVKNGVEDTKSHAVEEWSGMEEKYFLRAIDANTTKLRAITHVEKDAIEFINTGFNKGFELIKVLAEKS